MAPAVLDILLLQEKENPMPTKKDLYKQYHQVTNAAEHEKQFLDAILPGLKDFFYDIAPKEKVDILLDTYRKDLSKASHSICESVVCKHFTLEQLKTIVAFYTANPWFGEKQLVIQPEIIAQMTSWTQEQAAKIEKELEKIINKS